MLFHHFTNEEIEFSPHRHFQCRLCFALGEQLHPKRGADGSILRGKFHEFGGIALHNGQRDGTQFGIGRKGVFGKLHFLDLLACLLNLFRLNLAFGQLGEDLLQRCGIGKGEFDALKTAEVGHAGISLILRRIDGVNLRFVLSHVRRMCCK